MTSQPRSSARAAAQAGRRGPARTSHEHARGAARERGRRGGATGGSPRRCRSGAAALRELRQRGSASATAATAASASSRRCTRCGTSRSRHRGPHARGLAAVAHALGAALQARAPHARISRRPPRRYLPPVRLYLVLSVVFFLCRSRVLEALYGAAARRRAIPAAPQGQPTITAQDAVAQRRCRRGPARPPSSAPHACARTATTTDRGADAAARSAEGLPQESTTTAAQLRRSFCTTCRAPCSCSCRCSPGS